MRAYVVRKIWDGKIHDFMSEIREVLETEPPLSKKSDVDEFMRHATWLDMIKEVQVAKEQITGNLMAGDSGYSDEFLRGQMAAFSILLQLPEYIYEQVSQQEEEENGS